MINLVKFPLMTLSPRLSFWLVSSRTRPGVCVAATFGILGGNSELSTRSDTLELMLDVVGTVNRRCGDATVAAAGGNTPELRLAEM